MVSCKERKSRFLLPGYPEDQSMRIGVVTFCHWIYVAARLCRYRLPHLAVPTDGRCLG
ncbi:hypothetical protein [Desulfobulbus oralis]|uniref:hypothetical protein n=1 Tax=Desulfobulbus oralis TaxID=1986146 RepID=UPI0003A0863A|nr:hypothetical protein [Desulfobulbus oralis]